MDNITPTSCIEDTLEELTSKFLTSEKLYKEIDDLVWEEDISYLDATVRILDEKQIDFESITKLDLVSPMLYSKLYEEASTEGFLKKEAVLPLC